jgi:GNAT superfamily N-acetyltransferase
MFDLEIDGHCFSDDPARFDPDLAYDWIARQAYWATGIPRAVFDKALANSLTFAAYAPDGAMAAMARVVTDRATFGLLCDVFVDPARRGGRLGKGVMTYFHAHPDLQGFRRRMLATADAHGLYAQFGFKPLGRIERWMEIHDPEVYRPS